MKPAVSFAAALALAFLPALTGFIGGPGEWYQSLAKPTWNPPSWLFGPVWTVLYASMGVASWLVWRSHSPMRRPALAAYFVQLILNALWKPLFFGLKRPDLAFIDIAALWVTIGVTIALSWRVRKLAGAILLPYLAWVTFAAALNFTIWRMNS